MHKSLKSINTVIFEGILLLKAHVVSFFSYLTSVPRTFDLDCRSSGRLLDALSLKSSSNILSKDFCVIISFTLSTSLTVIRDWEGKTGIWAYGPWPSKVMGHVSSGMGQKFKKNIGVLVRQSM